MPHLIDYERVAGQMTRGGLVSLYPSSGAFGFPPEVAAIVSGWIGPDDPTIRDASRALVRQVAPPFEPNLARSCAHVWREHLPGPVWVLPKSHWAYELAFGSQTWLPGALMEAGLTLGGLDTLAVRHDGTALEFTMDEGESFERLLVGLLLNLFGSDFLLAWPGRPVVCTVHHHKQLWWSTTDAALARQLSFVRGPL